MEKKVDSVILTVDCNLQPKIHRSFGIKNHQGRGVINFDLSNLKAFPVSSKFEKNEAYIFLEETLKRFGRNKKNIPACANVLDEVLKHLGDIPKKYSKPGVYLLFLNTTYLKKGGVLSVRALNYAKNGWYETVILNGDHLATSDFVVCV